MLGDLFQGNQGDYRKLNFKMSEEETLAQQVERKRKEKKLAEKEVKKAAKQNAPKFWLSWNIALPKINFGNLRRMPVETKTAEVKTSPFSEEDQAMLREQEALLAQEMGESNKEDNPPMQMTRMEEPKASQNRDKRIGFTALGIGLGVCVLGIAAVTFMNGKQKKNIQPKAVQAVNMDSLFKANEGKRIAAQFAVVKNDIDSVKKGYDSVYSNLVGYFNEALNVAEDEVSSSSLDFADDSTRGVFANDSVRLSQLYPSLQINLDSIGIFTIMGKGRDTLYPLQTSKLEYHK